MLDNDAQKIALAIETMQEINDLFKKAPAEEINQLMRDCQIKGTQPNRTPDMVRQAFLLRSGLILGTLMYRNFDFDPKTREFTVIADGDQ